MQIKSIVAGVAIALLAGLSSASAEDLKTVTGAHGFVTVGVSGATPLSTTEMSAIRGADIIRNGGGDTTISPELVDILLATGAFVIGPTANINIPWDVVGNTTNDTAAVAICDAAC
jgi:hypothetical protein